MVRLTPEAEAELRGYAENGRAGPGPENVVLGAGHLRPGLHASDLTPLIDSVITVQWRAGPAHRPYLTIGHNRRLVEHYGRIRVGVEAAAPIVVLLSDGDVELARLEVRPRPLVPQLHLEAPDRVEEGQAEWVTWCTRHAEAVSLLLHAPGQPVEPVPVPPSGRWPLPDNLAIGAYEITIEAVSRHHHLDASAIAREVRIVSVVPPPASVRVATPRRITLGQPLAISWVSRHAESVIVSCAGSEHRLPPEGEFECPALRYGPFPITVLAIGPGGAGRHRAVVDVTAPDVRISAPRSVELQFGDDGTIAYEVSGAKYVELVAAGASAMREAIPSCGTIKIESLFEDRVLKILATGFDNAHHHHRIRIAVLPPGALLAVDDHLSCLYGEPDPRAAVLSR